MPVCHNEPMDIVMSADIDIRDITPDDAAAAAALSEELGYPVSAQAMRTRIEQLIAGSDHGLFVACRQAQAIGWVHVSAVQHLQADPRAEIGGLVVTASARSAGVGARLLSRAEQWARENGFDSVLVRSQIKREDAHRFYLREGYERTKTSAVFSKRQSTAAAHHFASGSGRSWKCAANGRVPLPPSISHGVRSPLAAQRPRPFQPADGSSMRPSNPFA
jgi:GNAT superfamily N-acetyltransferase